MRQPETLAPLSTARNALGTRFCHVCNDFRPIDQFRKGQGHVCRQHVEVPDPDGLRFCRVCQDLLPLSRFAADQKRFICRACTWKRTGKSARTKYRARRAHIQRLWSMCYTDRAAFHQLRVGVTQTDIASVIKHCVRSGLFCAASRTESWSNLFFCVEHAPAREAKPTTGDVQLIKRRSACL